MSEMSVACRLPLTLHPQSSTLTPSILSPQILKFNTPQTSFDVIQNTADGQAKKTKTAEEEWVGGEEFAMVAREEATAEEMFHQEEVRRIDWAALAGLEIVSSRSSEMDLLQIVDHATRAAWQFVDKGGSEYLRVDDAEMLLHNLGARMTRKQVEDLVDSVSVVGQGITSGEHHISWRSCSQS